LLLTLQRLDYAQDAGKLMQTSSLMDQSYDTLLEDFRLLKTTNPFIVQIMSSIEENVIEFQSKAADKYSSKEVALDVGISILSQVISVAKADFTYLDKQTCSILQGLQTEKKW
jgi:DNA-binding NarL/FixJ family response regulator